MSPNWKPERIRVDELNNDHLGHAVQVPGQRGVLRGFWTDADGKVAVVTPVGIAHYPADTLAWVEQP